MTRDEARALLVEQGAQQMLGAELYRRAKAQIQVALDQMADAEAAMMNPEMIAAKREYFTLDDELDAAKEALALCGFTPDSEFYQLFMQGWANMEQENRLLGQLSNASMN